MYLLKFCVCCCFLFLFAVIVVVDVVNLLHIKFFWQAVKEGGVVGSECTLNILSVLIQA